MLVAMPRMIALVLALVVRTATPLPACESDAQHFRWALKTRPAPASPYAIVDHLSVRQLVAWNVPAAARSDDTIDVRERGVYRLTGYVRLAKISPDDCDLHLQVSDTATGNGPQIIAEIPPTDVDLQREVARLVGGVSTRPHRFDGALAVPLTITGYAFVDQEHATKIPSKRGHARGTAAVATVWQIHPGTDVQP